jgi:hypothetical protein
VSSSFWGTRARPHVASFTESPPQTAVVAVGAASVATGVGLAAVNPGTSWILTFALVLVLALPLLARVAAGRFDPFEPLMVFVLAYGVMFVVRPVAMLSREHLAFERSYGSIDVSDTFDEMLMIALVGAAAFVGGYSLPAARGIANRIAPPPGAQLDVRALAVAASAVAALGVASSVAFIASSGGAVTLDLILAGRSTALNDALRASSKYLWYGSYLLIPACLTLLAAGRAARERAIVVLGVVLLGLVLLRALPLGSRMMLLPLVVGGIVYGYVSRGRRPRAIVLAATFLAALVISSVLLSVRNAEARESGGVVAAVAATAVDPARILDPLTEGDDAAMAPLLAAALHVVPESVPHMHGGAVVGDFVTRPVPRQVWPAKPLPPRERITALLWPGNRSVNPEFSLLLYPYLDFGLLGVAIAMAMFGIGARVLYAYFQLHSASFGGRLMFALAIPFLVVGVRDSPVDTFMRATFVLAPAWLILRFAETRRSAAPLGRFADSAYRR